jgi:hypothetical protein
VNALRKIHAALIRDGFVVDTQPVSARPQVQAERHRLGTLDMREWLKTIDAVDELVARTVDDGLYVIEDEQRFLVTDTFESGRELVETVSGWQGTRISRTLGERVVAARPPVCVHQEVRLRLLRAGSGSDRRPGQAG